MAYDEVNEDNVYTCVGHPLRREIENIINWMLNEDFNMAYNSILSPNTFSCRFHGPFSKSVLFLSHGFPK